MRMIIIAVIAILLLGGGGAGAYFYFSQPAEASAGEEVAEAQKKAKEAEKSSAHGEAEHHEFVELDPLILPIVDETGVTQVVSLVVALEVADKVAADKVTALTPKIKDAFIQDMYGVLNKQAALKGGVVQVSAIKNRLNKISQGVLGEGVVVDVLLQVVQQRPI